MTAARRVLPVAGAVLLIVIFWFCMIIGIAGAIMLVA